MAKRGIVRVSREVLEMVLDCPHDATISSCTWDGGKDELHVHLVGNCFSDCPDGVVPVNTRINRVVTKNVVETKESKFNRELPNG